MQSEVKWGLLQWSDCSCCPSPIYKNTSTRHKEQGWGSRSILALRSCCVSTLAGHFSDLGPKMPSVSLVPGLFDTSPHLHDLYHHPHRSNIQQIITSLQATRSLCFPPLSTRPSPPPTPPSMSHKNANDMEWLASMTLWMLMHAWQCNS